MPIASASDLLAALREHRVLAPAQLDAVDRSLQGKRPEPAALARALVQRGWLTAYQANELIQGRGAGLVLGPYLLLDRLGEGGMGQVFKARHQLMDRVVALKLIRKDRLQDDDAVKRFHREIRLAAQLDHPHLVRALDAAQVGEIHVLAMEYAEGTDLQALVQKAGPLAVGQACTYIRQAALGLQHAHERGLVHRDVKPSNLQVTAHGGAVKVLDMGLARLQAPAGAGRVTELTGARTLLGTPDYMAPEQIDDPRRVDGRADIYSLGCTLYFLLAGRPPFPGGAWEEKLAQHRKAEPQPIEQLRPDVPPGLGAVLRTMMAKRPEDRYPNPAAVAEALAPFCPAGGAVPATVSAALPAAAPSLVQPGGPEPGWTLEVKSTLGPAPAPPTAPGGPRPPAGPTVLVHPAPAAATVPGQPGPAGRRPPWLLLAGGLGVLAVLVLVAVLSWPGGDKKEVAAGGTGAGGTGGTSPGQGSKGTGPAGTPVSDRPVLGDDLPPDRPASMTGHAQGTCVSVAFLPDGLRAVSQCQGKAYVWDLRQRTLAREAIELKERGYGHAGLVVPSPDGKRVAFSTYAFFGLLDGKTYEPVGEGTNLVDPIIAMPITAMAFSPDGALLAVAVPTREGQGRVRIFDAGPTRKEQKVLLYGGAIFGLAFSPDGAYLATASGSVQGGIAQNAGEKSIRVRQWRSGREVRELVGHKAAVTHVAFSGDGKHLYSASAFDGTLRVWPWDGGSGRDPGKEEQTIRVRKTGPGPQPLGLLNGAAFTCLAFWPRGRAFVGYPDGSVALWDLGTGEGVPFPPRSNPPTASVTAVAISPDGHHGLAAMTDGLVYLYRLPPPRAGR